MFKIFSNFVNFIFTVTSWNERSKYKQELCFSCRIIHNFNGLFVKTLYAKDPVYTQDYCIFFGALNIVLNAKNVF